MQLHISLPTDIRSPTTSTRFRHTSTSTSRALRKPSIPLLLVICVFGLTVVLLSRPSSEHLPTSDAASGESWTELGLAGGVGDALNRFGEKLGKGGELLGLGACAGWDPLAREEHDPVGCMRAKQYRQVQRVLAREEKGEHGHWWFTQKPNVLTLKKLARCYLPANHINHVRCPDRPVVINGYWWSAMTILNGTSGESIWQESILKQFESFGIMTLFVGDYQNWITVAEMMPDVYRFIWAPEVDIISCFTDPRCVAAEHYVPPENATDLSLEVPDDERGVIPIWRLQIVDYWGSQPKEVSNNDHYWALKAEGEWSYHSLGAQWIQTPWPMPGHVHLPYSIEEYCLKLPMMAHDQRDDSVLIFAKRSKYFHMQTVPPIHFWTDLAQEPNFTLLSTAEVEEGAPLPDGLNTLRKQTREAYEALVGGSKVLLGMGFPPISPSVYTALCQGTPVVLPYRVAGRTPPKSGWGMYSGHFQHGPAMAIGPPYVYSYFRNNYTELLEVVNKALNTPIERYIPKDMTLPYALSQTKAFLNRDLHAMFRKVLKKNGGAVPRFIAGAKERCDELKRCKPALEAGRRPYTPPSAQNRE